MLPIPPIVTVHEGTSIDEQFQFEGLPVEGLVDLSRRVLRALSPISRVRSEDWVIGVYSRVLLDPLQSSFFEEPP